MRKLKQQAIKWTENSHYSSSYNEEQLAFFLDSEINKSHSFLKTYRSYAATPLHHLHQLADYLQVGDILVKDESHRFGLNAFKVMGGIYAMAKYIAQKIDMNIAELSFDKLKSPKVKEQVGDLTFISATDGNHGRGVAWAARELGYKSIIYMPKGSSEYRLKAIREEGAEAYITDQNYDETVRICAELAEENSWVMVQDTAWEGYDDIPLWIMQGYAVLAKEIVEQLKVEGNEPPTHVFLQAGVGSFAGAISAYLTQYYQENPPKIMIVEPEKADCFYRSFLTIEGSREMVGGEMDTIMAGLACGEPNTRAFELLRQYAIGAFSCQDKLAALGMRVYGNPIKGDPQIVSGESGAVTLGLLYYLQLGADETLSQEIGLNKDARVLLISTEGNTDPEHYQKVVWQGHYSNK
ncbi:diaminopropionate ammonia-lyase [Cytobacillus kochii]|uniref:diaminopropionate ammonia-lyase n=1 Tax=Cytobacillus kochii TaxID=859143 RepID=UPI002E1C5E5C|nr:diaminopropionate ammonia-lyase [Cytobacillus kochii]MED1607560.1 diaminopropionate ammonia-lyase [Cytobacillus kochii]